MSFDTTRAQVHATVMDLCDAGLVRLSAGNVSARAGEGRIAITPSGLLYSRMTPEDIVIIDLDGRVVEGSRKPSSETPMHTAIYRRYPEAGAIVHTHSVHAIALAVVGMEIPMVCLEVLPLGGAIPVAPYACPGTPGVGEAACKALGTRAGVKAVLLRNHGLVAIGESLEQAFGNAYNCETAAEIYLLALQTGRTPVALSQEQVSEIQRRYQHS